MESRRIRRETNRELAKIDRDLDVFYSAFFNALFDETLQFSYNEIFNHFNGRLIIYANWANKYKYKRCTLDSFYFHNQFKSNI